MAKIKDITARQILDSRGNPTIETTVVLSDNAWGTASVPSGASVGSYEAVELRDQDPQHYQGMSVYKAIDNIKNLIAPKLLGRDAHHQSEIDKTMIELDNTQNKGILGANAMLSVSIAVAKAAAKSSVLPLFMYLRQFIDKGTPLKIPTPLFNVVNGGKHGGENVNFQEFMVIPATSLSFPQALEMGVNLYKTLKKVLLEKNLSTQIGDEGGYSPLMATNIDVFELLKQTATLANLRVGFDMFFGMDAAANNFYKDGHYLLKDKAMSFSSHDLISYYEDIKKQYSLLYLEDPFFEDDYSAWADLCLRVSQDTMVVGDDLVTTNPYRLQMAIAKKALTAVIIKPNQIGTVIETLAVVEVARLAGLKIIVSHRSGETNDDFIADFAVAVSADLVKFGAPARGERVAKYNRLLQIEKQLKAL